ncbi:RepB family plasmid replication initiator protein [Helicobacter apodemus]|uniref:RepB family plasmid replication initiator protein n=1 Tax=Helicobacter apodemus TaxID=135569 RepID=A0A4U8UDJ5_9HELI|nr:replication initiation protein [Helicobacter apodemus]TLE15921.1 RepB family plasmid replication initiator protein [Helicobacter apodemus]
MQLNRDLNLISKTNCKSKAKSKDIVNFSSLFNQVALKNFTKIDMDILFFIVKKVYNKNKKLIKFEINELINLIDSNGTRFKNKIRLLENIESFCEKLQTSFIKNYVINGKTTDLYRITLFNVSSHYENGILKFINVKITPEAVKFFNNVNEYNLVAFSLEEFSFISSKHSKNLYRIAKQIERSKSKSWVVNSFLLENIMDIKESHKNKYKATKVQNFYLSPALKELNGKNYLGNPYFRDKLICETIKENKVTTNNKVTHNVVAYKLSFIEADNEEFKLKE